MNSQDLLSTIQRNSQICQITIRRALDTVMCSSLRGTLQAQLREYDTLETEALEIAHQRGWELPGLEMLHGIMTDRKVRFRLFLRNKDSGIAELLIRTSTNGLISSLKDLHQYNGSDFRVRILSQKMLDCADAHIRQLQPYL